MSRVFFRCVSCLLSVSCRVSLRLVSCELSPRVVLVCTVGCTWGRCLVCIESDLAPHGRANAQSSKPHTLRGTHRIQLRGRATPRLRQHLPSAVDPRHSIPTARTPAPPEHLLQLLVTAAPSSPTPPSAPCSGAPHYPTPRSKVHNPALPPRLQHPACTTAHVRHPSFSTE